MYLKITVEHLTGEDKQFMVAQYANCRVKALEGQDSVIVEQENVPFERAMELIAVAHLFPDHEVIMRQTGYEGITDRRMTKDNLIHRYREVSEGGGDLDDG